MPAISSEIGLVYDLLLQTPDGATLPCRNKDDKIVNISQVAYVTSIDRNAQGQHEETELQHKDHLVQLGSSNLIDREFDQWPQVTQGDWTGGMLQRVYSGPNSDPTRYWEGDGILWPVSDYLPQQGAQFAPLQDQNGAIMRSLPFVGTPAGSINAIGMSYAFAYTTTTGTIQTNLVIVNNDTKYTIVNPAGIATGNGTPSAPAPVGEFIIGSGALWYIVQNGANAEIRFVTVGGPTITLFDTIANATTLGNNTCSFGYVGNKVYLAVPYFNNVTPTVRIRIYEIENGLSASFTELNLADTTTVLGSSGQLSVTSTAFSGDTLYYATQNGNGDAFVVSYSLTSATFSTVAALPGEGQLFLTAVAGVVFVVSAGGSLYLLQGSALQHIGSLPPQIGPVVVSPGAENVGFINSNSLSHPVTFGPYAIFSAVYYPPSAALSILAVYAYDVLRGRLFRIGVVPNMPRGVPAALGARIGLLTGHTRTLVPGTVITPLWSIVVPTASSLNDTLSISNAQILDIGVRRTNLQTAQLGVAMTSSVIDFTSAQPKLYRDVLAKFSPLAASPSCGVKLDIWLDQDPASLNLSPDFTLSVFGDAGPGATQLVTRINRLATKLVYRITTYGGVAIGASGSIISAPKLISVIIRAATGWVQTLKLDLAPNVQTNSKNGGVWEKQSGAGITIDAVVAYNFLRQLWRLKGGQCLATFPNKDSGSWLIQDLAFDSPKPFAASFRADQQSQYQSICTMKIRENIA